MITFPKYTVLKVKTYNQALAAGYVMSEVFSMPLDDRFIETVANTLRDFGCGYIGEETFLSADSFGGVIVCGFELEPQEKVLDFENIFNSYLPYNTKNQPLRFTNRDSKGRFAKK